MGFRAPKRHSFSRKRKSTAGALRIPPLRSLARVHRSGFTVPGGRRGEGFILLSPSGGDGILRAFRDSPRLFFSLSLSLTHSISVHGVPQNITRSRHSFFTVDRRREPRDNNGEEERFATAITLTGERSFPSSPLSSAPLGPFRSLASRVAEE